MRKPRRPGVKLGLVIILAVMVGTIGSGFFRDLAASSDETYKGLKLFTDIIELVEKNYVDQVDTKDAIHKAIQGMMSSLDPHSAFMPPEAFDELKMDTKGEFGGIGIVITTRKGIITVISPIEGTPAYRAGIKAGDKIYKVDGVTTEGMALWEAVKKMRGPKDTDVVITVIREGAPEPIDFKLTRDIIPIESVKHLVLKPGYGYIWLTNFRKSTTEDLAAALADLSSGEVPLEGLILDLRDNPGGLLDQAVQVADMFLDTGKIVSIQGRMKRHTKVFRAQPDEDQGDYPIVVLINGGSASASEIVAGALQDNKRALILGTTSFGKGSVQTVETLRDGYGLKFTIARYYTPNGTSIQAQGIVPDIMVSSGVAKSEKVDSKDGLVKEKDLKNHLEAEPSQTNEKKAPSKKSDSDTSEKSDAQNQQVLRAKSRHIPLKGNDLLADRQVKRALEILVGHAVLARQ